MSNLTRSMMRIVTRKRSYQRTFLNQDGITHPDAEAVLADLKRFCRVTTSTAAISPVTKSIDPIAMAMAEGRREVWNRIMAHLYIDDRIVLNLKEPDPGE